MNNINSLNTINPLTHIMDFLACLPLIGLPVVIGKAIAIESMVAKILKKESDSDSVLLNNDSNPDIQNVQNDYKKYMLLEYGKFSCQGGITGVLTAITAIVLAILNIIPVAAAVFFGIASALMLVIALYKVSEVNAFLAENFGEANPI